MTDIEKLLKDRRLCRSENMIKFFKKERNRHYDRVIRFEGVLWFANTEWGTKGRKQFAGVRVGRVAAVGSRAETGFPVWQHESKWHDVTEWFWKKYWEQGVVSIPEVWHREIPRPLTSKEAHSI